MSVEQFVQIRCDICGIKSAAKATAELAAQLAALSGWKSDERGDLCERHNWATEEPEQPEPETGPLITGLHAIHVWQKRDGGWQRLFVGTRPVLSWADLVANYGQVQTAPEPNPTTGLVSSGQLAWEKRYGLWHLIGYDDEPAMTWEELVFHHWPVYEVSERDAAIVREYVPSQDY